MHHFDNLEDYFIYPIQLEQRLPQIAIPLLPGDPAVMVDLQAVLNHCYDAGPYARELNYQADAPLPPLRPDQEEWAKGILQR